ncbi:hypothetical protein FBU30_004200 [Linnemannia zychae]|nr:hypothetical protein FBU30_004200 [Linnemannia zychae]
MLDLWLDLPTEIQVLIMSKLSLLELLNAKLISQQFKHLANVDQLWRRHTLQSHIEDNIMREAREVCGANIFPIFSSISTTCSMLSDDASSSSSSFPETFSWQTLLRTATLIDRENRRLVQGNLSKMTQKIHQVREALERQTRVLEETHQKLELLSGRLTQMEEASRVRELERTRAIRREEARLEDERWLREWDALCSSHQLRNAEARSSSCPLKQDIYKEKINRDAERNNHELGILNDIDMYSDLEEVEEEDELLTVNSSFINACSIETNNESSLESDRSNSILFKNKGVPLRTISSDSLDESQALNIEMMPNNGKARAFDQRAYPGL